MTGPVSPGFCLGLDLGTTFVTAAICDVTRPGMGTLGGRSVVMSSAVYLDEDGRLLCGEAAVSDEGMEFLTGSVRSVVR